MIKNVVTATLSYQLCMHVRNNLQVLVREKVFGMPTAERVAPVSGQPVQKAPVAANVRTAPEHHIIQLATASRDESALSSASRKQALSFGPSCCQLFSATNARYFQQTRIVR